MKLHFLADMNLSPFTVEDLIQDGYNITRVSNLLPASAPDAMILNFARQQDMVVITQDLDFSALLALGGHNRPSLVTLRLTNTDPSVVPQRLRQILPQVEQALFEGSAITVDDVTIRIRRLPIR